MDLKTVFQRYGKCIAGRTRWLNVWQDVYDLTLPMREGFFADTPGEEKMDTIYDETAVDGIQEFASVMQDNIVPQFQRWLQIDPGTELSEEDANAIKGDLAEVTDFVQNVFHNSSWNTQAFESFLDLGLGTGVMQIDDSPETLTNYTALPFNQMTLDRGPMGGIGGFYRERKVRLEDIKIIWPSATIPDDVKRKLSNAPESEVNIIESMRRSYSEIMVERWHYHVGLQQEEAEILHLEFEGAGSCPWLGFRWSTAANETYGRGPLINALPAIRSANLTMQLTFENLELAIGGIFQADDDDEYNYETMAFRGSTVIPRTPGTRGLEPLQSSHDFNASNLVLSEMRTNIRRALFVEEFGQMSKTPRSASEYAFRNAKLAQRIGAPYGRILTEFIHPAVIRTIRILKDAGRIDLPRVNGREVKLTPRSPLARAQREQDIVQLHQFVGGVVEALGPQAATMVNIENLVEEFANLYEIPEKLLTTEAERKELAGKMREQMLAQQGGQAGAMAPAGAPAEMM